MNIDIDIVRILWTIFKRWIFLNRMWSLAPEHRANSIDRSFKWQTRKFFANFWHLRNSIKEIWIEISFQGITITLSLFFAIHLFNFEFNNQLLWNSFSNDKPFPSSVFLSFWTTCPPTTLTSTGKGKLFMNLCCPPGLWDVWDVSPDITRSDEMWWGRSLELGYSREYFMMTTDPRSVIRSTLRLHRPWLCCCNNYYYTRGQ